MLPLRAALVGREMWPHLCPLLVNEPKQVLAHGLTPIGRPTFESLYGLPVLIGEEPRESGHRRCCQQLIQRAQYPLMVELFPVP